MKRKLTLISTAFLLSAAFTLISCGNDDENNNTAFITPDGKVDVARAVEFRVNFGDYTSEEELQGTRAAKTEESDTLSRQYVELDNGLLAEVTVQKDTAKTQTSEQRPVTRTLDDDTYTMLAYKDGVLKGEMTGFVSSGKFTATGSNKNIILAEGTYDFVLFNSKVTRNGDNLTVTVSDVGTALIGRTQYTVTTDRNQQVTFTMNHVGSRLSIKLTGYMDIKEGTAATLSSVDASSVPNTAVYNAATGTWSYGAEAAISGNLTFPASKEAMYRSTTYTSQSNYMYFLPSADPSKLKLTFTGGRIYNKDMAGAGLTLSVPTLPSMKANTSYIINVKLMYNFLYLMSDGTTGFINQTTYGGGSKTPIGVVVSRSKSLAVALKDAKSWFMSWWQGSGYANHNHRKFEKGQESNSFADMDGYRYTWESNAPTGSSDIKAEKMKDGAPEYPAFYYAGHYGEYLSTELAAQGKALSDGMETKKWHLPSTGEWTYVFTALGFGDRAALTTAYTSYSWYGNLANVAFTQVGGTAMNDNYWSSSEFRSNHPSYNDYGGLFNMEYISSLGIMTWSGQYKSYSFRVRAFVKY